jgi:predicted nucleotidyltransferase
MNLEHYSSQKLKNEVRTIISKYLDVNIWKVFFFGSRVKGDNLPASDIDIGVMGPVAVSAEKKLQIQEELNNIRILYKIDLVDFAQVNEEFKKEAMRSVEYV